VPGLDRSTLAAGVAALARRDSRLAQLARRHGCPPLWGRRAGFATLLRIILEQQVSLASARALYRRLGRVTRTVSPDAILVLGTGGLRAIGFTRQKASYAVGLAEQVQSRRLALGALPRLPDIEAAARLVQVPGVGPWTAAIYLLMALRRPDVWPPGDLALHKALARLDGMDVLPTSRQAEARAAAWRPYRAVAARLLWQNYLAERRVGPVSA
jgi:DNA-3-methyladenine glycosylase II